MRNSLLQLDLLHELAQIDSSTSILCEANGLDNHARNLEVDFHVKSWSSARVNVDARPFYY